MIGGKLLSVSMYAKDFAFLHGWVNSNKPFSLISIKINKLNLRKGDYAFLGTWTFYLYSFFSGFGMGVSPPFYFFGRQ